MARYIIIEETGEGLWSGCGSYYNDKNVARDAAKGMIKANPAVVVAVCKVVSGMKCKFQVEERKEG